MPSGKLIAICGIDGSGKSTQQDLLVRALGALGIETHATRQPSNWYRGLPWVRAYLDHGRNECSPAALALLAAADRLIHCETEIGPRIESGHWVVSDRYVYSSYALFRMRGVPEEFVRAINSRVPAPDAGILLVIDPEEAHRRLYQRESGRVKYEERNVSLLRKAQDELLAVWPKEFLVADASIEKERLAGEILEYLKALLPAPR